MDFDMFNIPVINLDYYDALGLKREDDPTMEQIQAAYRHLALQWHPERNKTSSKRETASLKFIEINEAYKVLMDKKQREAKQAAKTAKHKHRKEERALSPRGRSALGLARLTSPVRSRSRSQSPNSRVVSQLPKPELFVSNPDESSVDGTVRGRDITPRSSVADIPGAFPPPRSAVASPTHLSASLPLHNHFGAHPPHSSRGPSPMRGPSPARGRSSAPPSREPSPNPPRARIGAWAEETSAYAVRPPPTVFSFGDEERSSRGPMSDLTSELGSDTSFTNGYTASVATSSQVSTSTHVPDDWVFPIYLTLEDLYTCKSHRFRINRHLLSGISKEVFVDVSVQPNWRDGTQLRCKGLGNEREGLPPQDVIFLVKESLHPRFLRDPVGYDIYARLEISLVIALGGGSASDEALAIKGVDGREIVVEVPPPVVRHGSMTRIKGAGMPKYKSKDGSVPLRGDLMLEWCVLPPEKPLSEDAMAELREALGYNWLLEDEEMMG
ncbi:DnaJ-domain-containing protein [Ceratobasidium sp. AG-I]|nr:DnaJ-domain-containing protein [Ceratobasidium sp. AG-I]